MNNDDFFRVIDPENSRQIIPTSPYRKPPQPRKKKAGADSEAAIQLKIIKYLQKAGFKVLRTNSGSLKDAHGNFFNGNDPGTADIHVNVFGRYTAIEVKRPGNKPTELQQKYINRINREGGLAFVACSVDEVKQRLAIELATPLMQMLKQAMEVKK